MAIEERKYPGELASPHQIHELAEEYRKAANLLLQQGRPGKPLTRAVQVVGAIHAIELYLTALLLHRGHSPIRSANCSTICRRGRNRPWK
ncbi:hypothetical protein RFM40_25165 [Mesorhizobium sp. VK22E]|nr:hypothetical protein [Mesorhizobium sp. VK22E]